jgi:hypothetical protein
MTQSIRVVMRGIVLSSGFVFEFATFAMFPRFRVFFHFNNFCQLSFGVSEFHSRYRVNPSDQL